MTETLHSPAPALARSDDPTTGFRRIASAVALPAAFALQAVTNTIYAVATRDGGGDTGPAAETIAFYHAHGQELVAASVIAMVGVLLVVPGVLAALRVLRPSRPRLSLIAGILMIAGYICYFGIVMTGFLSLALANSGVAQAPAILQEGQDHPLAMPFLLLFVIGNLVGTLLLGLAVMLSRTLPWWVGALIMGWPVGHIVNLVGCGEWFAVAGGVLEVIGLCFVAGAALRTPDAVWARRG